MAFSWGSSNSNNNNANGGNPNAGNNGGGGGGGGFGTGWGSSTNNNSKPNGGNNNANASSFGFGGNNTSEGNNAGHASGFGNGSGFGANTSTLSASPWGASNTNQSNANQAIAAPPNNALNANSNSNSNAPAVNPNNDHVVPDTAPESISCVAFHPNTAHFIVGAWDNSLRYFEHRGAKQSRKVAQQAHQKPVLSCCFDTNSGDRVFSAGCDNAVRQWQPQQNSFSELGQHAAPVRSVLFSGGGNMVVTGSWDKTVAAWDPRSTKQCFATQLGHKVFAMALHGHVLVVGCSDHDIRTLDLRQSGKVVHSVREEETRNKSNGGAKKTKEVSLKKQIRCIDMFPNGEGYVAASVGGRVIIKHLDRSRANKDFSYKCHRHSVSGGRNGSLNHIFAVNVVRFHRQTAVFATAGDDGECVTWDKDGRAKLFTFQGMRVPTQQRQSENNEQIDSSRMPIVALDYHANGQFMLYATSYNWNKGQEFNRPQQQRPQVYLHQVQPKEMDKSKNKK